MPLSRTLRTLATASLVVAAALAPLAPATAQAATGRGSARSYTLTRMDGQVMRWNPCAPIHYRVNTRYAPAGALADARAAVARVAAATGMHFVYDGATAVIPQAIYGGDATAASAPPLVIAWARPGGSGAGSSDLLGSQAGEGGWVASGWSDQNGDHPDRIITGYVVLSTRVNALPGGFTDRAGGTRGELLLHELGHAVGLQHTADPSQVMYPRLGRYASYGAGDLTGLHLVGRAAGCLR